jgi:succinoglycan biosynthesis protein ExoA
MTAGPRPSIAFVVATLDEAHGIEACVRSLLDQRYPADRIEVVVVDGGSTDDTQTIVAGLAEDDRRVRLLANPSRIAASAFNIGVAATEAELVSLVSAHSTLDPDYASVLAEAFEASGAWLVGGRMEAEPETDPTPASQAIVLATSSPLGLGSAKFHYADEATWVDTAFPGAYRRELFAEIGGFDEQLVRNQDDDLHFRARLAGHRMWFDPRLRSRYRPRRTIAALWRQYFEYGWWRSVTLRKHGKVASVRHLVPAVLVAGLGAGPVLAVVPGAGGLRRLWVAGAAGWAVVLVVAGARERDAGAAVAARVPVTVGCLHLAYGSGFWGGVAHQLASAIRRTAS